MISPGWTRPESPFHEGELAIQERLGVRNRIDKQGRRIIREYLTDQHRHFFSQLSYVIVGTVDECGAPWASIVVGQPGFLCPQGDRLLRVRAQLLHGDPLADTLAEGNDIGILGIELHTRRRNRINGVISAVYADGFDIQIGQTFGNCPQYIQSRQFQHVIIDPNALPPRHHIATLSESERTSIASADTFFITTAYQHRSSAVTSGVDVSHRGGKPGFIRIDDDRTLTVPDFSGNNHFNTFGNIELNPRAGLLFLDFDRGDLLYLSGTAEVIWDGAEVSAFAGAERLLRFHLNQGYRVAGTLPLRWSSAEFSPYLERTGSWRSPS